MGPSKYKRSVFDPQNVDPGQTGVDSSLVCHFEEKQEKTQHP